MDYLKVYEEWIENPFFDDETKQELIAIKDDEKEIRERFSVELEFGTAGLRGVIGAGTNRMNKYVVARATQGLANYIIKQGTQDKGVAIAYDCRNFSPEFADVAALTLAANGIKAYRFESLRPTPELSFAVRYLGCTAGINVTASHNPPEYNGYKVYWADGAQITPPNDTGIMDEVKALKIDESKTMGLEEAKAAGLYISIGKEVDDAYIAELKKQIKHQDAIDKYGKDIKVVYSPLHGTGNIPARRILAEIGFPNVYVVPEQELPDGNFPTVESPNPENKEAFTTAIEMAKENGIDLIVGTDPDGDRCGTVVKNGDEYETMSGNQMGALLLDYLIQVKKEKGELKDNSFACKSIVSTTMANAICEENGIKLVLYSVPSPFCYNIRMHNGLVKLAEEKGVDYLDGNAHPDEIGIDWNQDTFDKGDHLNLAGSRKLTRYLAEYLVKECDLEDHRNDPAYRSWSDLWKPYEEEVRRMEGTRYSTLEKESRRKKREQKYGSEVPKNKG